MEKEKKKNKCIVYEESGPFPELEGKEMINGTLGIGESFIITFDEPYHCNIISQAYALELESQVELGRS